MENLNTKLSIAHNRVSVKNVNWEIKNSHCKGFCPVVKGSIGKAGETSGDLWHYQTFPASASHGMLANRKPDILQHETTPANQISNQ